MSTITTEVFNPRTASAAECRARNDRASFTVGDTVTVNDPRWYLHGSKGTVTKVNRVTIRVRMWDDGNTVTGGKCWFLGVLS